MVRNSADIFSEGAPPPEDTDPQAWTGLPVIFDEVFTGLTRLGPLSSASFLGVGPDISVHAKLLTGGLVPLCATLASTSIFKAFESTDKTDALLHGHSYTAHPIGCQVALESVKELRRIEEGSTWDWAKQSWKEASGQASKEGQNGHRQPVVWSAWSESFVSEVSKQPQVSGVWALGSVLAIYMKDAVSGYTSNSAARVQEALSKGVSSSGDGSWNVHSRVLGNVLYMMASQTTKREDIERLEGLLRKAIE